MSLQEPVAELWPLERTWSPFRLLLLLLLKQLFLLLQPLLQLDIAAASAASAVSTNTAANARLLRATFSTASSETESVLTLQRCCCTNKNSHKQLQHGHLDSLLTWPMAIF